MTDQPRRFDAVIVGAGFSGLYMLYRLRALGLSVRVLEAGSGIGGTWFWNRYPGARCDIESIEYSYSFSPELQQQWQWSERYPSQPEVLRYLEHVADRFELRNDIELDTRVVAARFDEPAGRWTIETARGERVSAKYCITAVGCLSAPNFPRIPGRERFTGPMHHTGQWPPGGVDVAGKRVGVIGTGSTAIQLIPAVAKQAAHLTVFQRTPNFSIPARNQPLSPELEHDIKARYPEVREQARQTFFGLALLDVGATPAAALSPAEQRAEMERRWALGGLHLLGVFPELLAVPETNAVVAEFVRDKIRAVVHDPAVAARLLPGDYPVGCKRICLDTDYYETFNRDNVSLVDARDSPIVEITPTGVRTADHDYALDVIVLATGFDAMTGALNNIDVRGRGGLALKDKWAVGPRGYLGLATGGFPNFLTITGPLSPSVISNMVVAIEQHVDWIAELVAHMEQNHIDLIDATPEAEDAWVAHVAMVGGSTIFTAPTCNSWYLGANVPGKPRVFTPYVGGIGPYGQAIQEVARNGYEGFTLTAAPR